MVPPRIRTRASADAKAMFAPCAGDFLIDPHVCFLNHGSFGATPKRVYEAQRQLQAQMEREPIRWFVEDLEPALDQARARMAAFVGCPAQDFSFVTNATAGVNAVVRSLKFQPGDELLTSSQEYNACNNVLRWAAKQWGAKVVSVDLPWPVTSEDEVVAAVLAGVTPRTRLAMVSHVTSPTAMILPVQRIVRELAQRGVDTLVDGAHAPGFLPLNVADLGCAYYTGNFHKWLCAPKGSAFLYVRPDRQAQIVPTIISHGANADRADRSRLRLEFDYIGSMDYTAWLVTPGCMDLVAELAGGGGWPEVMRANRAMALRVRGMLQERFGVGPLAPESMIGSMAAVRLPDRQEAEGPRPSTYADPLQDRLVCRWGVQVPIIPFPAAPRRHVRVSCTLYNTWSQYEYLADALAAEIASPQGCPD